MYFTGIAANHIKESSVKNHELAVKPTDAHVYRRHGAGALDMSAFDISMSTDGCHLYSPRELAQCMRYSPLQALCLRCVAPPWSKIPHLADPPASRIFHRRRRLQYISQPDRSRIPVCETPDVLRPN